MNNFFALSFKKNMSAVSIAMPLRHPLCVGFTVQCPAVTMRSNIWRTTDNEYGFDKRIIACGIPPVIRNGSREQRRYET